MILNQSHEHSYRMDSRNDNLVSLSINEETKRVLRSMHPTLISDLHLHRLQFFLEHVGSYIALADSQTYDDVFRRELWEVLERADQLYRAQYPEHSAKQDKELAELLSSLGEPQQYASNIAPSRGFSQSIRSAFSGVCITFLAAFFSPSPVSAQMSPHMQPDAGGAASQVKQMQGNALPSLSRRSGEYKKAKVDFEPGKDKLDKLWMEYLESLASPPPALTSIQESLVHKIWAEAKRVGLNPPIAEFAESEDGEEFFQLFWLVGEHHLEVEVYPNAYAEWFYKNHATREKLYGDDESEIGMTDELIAVFNRMA